MPVTLANPRLLARVPLARLPIAGPTPPAATHSANCGGVGMSANGPPINARGCRWSHAATTPRHAGNPADPLLGLCSAMAMGVR